MKVLGARATGERRKREWEQPYLGVSQASMSPGFGQRMWHVRWIRGVLAVGPCLTACAQMNLVNSGDLDIRPHP
jgi:hypothetical protein